MKKLLIFDVDGTVCDSCQEMDHFMMMCLGELKQTLVFISGTDRDELQRMVSVPLGPNYHYVFGSSGGTLDFAWDGTRKKMLDISLTKTEKKAIIKTLKKLCVNEKLIPITKDQILDRGSQITLSILGRSAPSDKKAAYDRSGKKRKNLIKKLQPLIGQDYDIKAGGTTSIDITKEGINKATALLNFLRVSGFKNKDAIYFGDQLQKGGNDCIVKETGIECIQVRDPQDTLRKLREMFNE